MNDTDGMYSTDTMTSVSLGFARRPVPGHRSISECARAIWQKRNRPSGYDLEIWLLAERRLNGAGGPTIRERLRARFVRSAGPHRSATSL